MYDNRVDNRWGGLVDVEDLGNVMNTMKKAMVRL